MPNHIDLIKLQLKIASGQALELDQDEIRLSGHAIECRINAEDPQRNFAPRPGGIATFRAPGGFGVRLDTHIEAGYVIPPFYDSMVGKLICWGSDREEAIARMIRALDEMVIDGVVTTATFHREILSHPRFRNGDFNTAFVGTLLEAAD